MYRLQCGFKKISGIEEHFRGGNLKKGKRLLSHVHNVEQLVQDGTVLVKAKCTSQVNDAVVYDVQLELGSSGQGKHDFPITAGTCTCKAGIRARCKHAAAVCEKINTYDDKSCTSQPQEWGKPSAKRRRPLPNALADLFPPRQSSVPNVKPAPRTTILAYEEIEGPMKEVLKLEQRHSDDLTCEIVLQNIVDKVASTVEKEVLQDLLKPMLDRPVYNYLQVLDGTAEKVDFMTDLDQSLQTVYSNKVALSATTSDLATLTLGQAQCLRWHEERKVRISSTMAHTVLLQKSTEDLEKAAQKLKKGTGYRNAAMQYGSKTEAAARDDLQQKLGGRIVQTGLVVLPEQPWLCCSPDGLVKMGNETVLVEIKCPFKFKDTPFINYEQKISFLPYLTFVHDEIVLKKTHTYYTQVQMQLYILNLQRAFLYVHSSNQSVIVCIRRDEPFLWKVVPKLEHFYFKFLLPKLFG